MATETERIAAKVAAKERYDKCTPGCSWGISVDLMIDAALEAAERVRGDRAAKPTDISARLRKLGVCDPGCTGRCLVCPLEAALGIVLAERDTAIRELHIQYAAVGHNKGAADAIEARTIERAINAVAVHKSSKLTALWNEAIEAALHEICALAKTPELRSDE